MPTAVIVETSIHFCPPDGSNPHVGLCCIKDPLEYRTVFIEGKEVARVGDKADCTSPSHFPFGKDAPENLLPKIVVGASTVFIEGKLAAISPGSVTDYGGTIVFGGCTSVMIE